ncbi:helix-turn-helix domain-containing protein [Niveispirillum sp. SYP-B3756]|nr:helix-turn-helix transcriptional regulator [Niveispirillum sp. SYP-B3756]MQP66628.1 helix-turn-helix domain-containing protein [Niveispirillum sp. SYP-B3756]
MPCLFSPTTIDVCFQQRHAGETQQVQHHDGVHLRTMRTSRGMSLATLANSAGLSKSEISKLENGVRPFRPDHVIRLAKIFGVGPSDMLSPSSPLRSMLGDSKAETELPLYDGRDLAREGSNATARSKTARPAALRSVAGAYAVTVADLNNAPAFAPGAVLLVNPEATAKVGDLVVNRVSWSPLAFYLRQDDDGGLYGLTLSRKRVELAMDDAEKLHRVVGIWLGD